MTRAIILDTFPLSCMGKLTASPPTLTDICQHWVLNCLSTGRTVYVPAITYFETLRELERLKAPAQIARLKTFVFSNKVIFVPLETVHLESAAKLWAHSRNIGRPTADKHSLDGDVILAAQALDLAKMNSDLVVATTNVAHIARYVRAQLWSDIQP